MNRTLVAVTAIAATLVLSLGSASATPVPHFGRIFALPAFTPPTDAMNDLGANLGPMFDPNAATDDNPDRDPSGFTYFGQFVDHDMTLDLEPLVDAPVPVEGLINHRQPVLDLDSLYGGGPGARPDLYDDQGRIVLSAEGRDHQRRPDGSAVLAEARNDENQILSQIHVSVARFHNALIDQGQSFKKAREATILHYQWVVLHDFLPRFVGQDTLDAAIDGDTVYHSNNQNAMMMPVEFSTAAYRFGHSMVRRAYRLTAPDSPQIQVFNVAGNDLRGGRPLPADRVINWNNFFEINPGDLPVNVSRKIDPMLSSGLFLLPPGSPGIPGEGSTLLAQRNLVRGKSYGLPSGQAVATALGLTPLTNAQLGLADPRFENEAPLWFYILAEAQLLNNGARLGPVGAKLVTDVFVGMLKKDHESLLHPSQKKFVPMGGADFRMDDFLRFAGVVS